MHPRRTPEIDRWVYMVALHRGYLTVVKHLLTNSGFLFIPPVCTRTPGYPLQATMSLSTSQIINFLRERLKIPESYWH
jgi:hypothetical protein